MRSVLIVMLLFIIPLLLEEGVIYNINISKREKSTRCIFAVIVVNVIGIVFYFSMKNLWTVYEYLLLYAIISIIVATLILPLLYREILNIERILFMFCLLVVSVAFYSILTYGQANIHSDTATATILAQCQVRSRSIFPRTWCYANGEIWVLGLNLFVLPFSVLLQNQSLARMLGSVLLTITVLTVMYYHSRKIFNNQSWLLNIPLLLLYLRGTLDVVLYQAAYIGQILWIVLTSSMVSMIFYGKRQKRSIFYLTILIILLCMGSVRYIAENTIPLWGACMILLYVRNQHAERIEDCKDDIKRAVFMSILILLPSLIGLGLYKILCNWCFVVDTGANSLQFVRSLQDCWENMIAAFLNIFQNFGFVGGAEIFSVEGIGNLISIIFGGIIVFIVPVLQLVRLKEEKETVVFFYIFGMLHNFLMFLIVIFCGKTVERYMLTSVFVSIIITSQYVAKYWLKKVNLQKVAIIICFIVVSSVQCFALFRQSTGWQKDMEAQKEFVQKLVNMGLRKGYASYWKAYSNEVYSDLQLQISGIHIGENGIAPYYWLVDSEVFHVEDENTFLLLTQEEKDTIGGNIPTLFGEPTEELILDGMYVFVFDYDIIKKAGWS